MDAAEEALAVVRVRSWLRSGRAREVRKRAGLSQSDGFDLQVLTEETSE